MRLYLVENRLRCYSAPLLPILKGTQNIIYKKHISTYSSKKVLLKRIMLNLGEQKTM